jgi:heme exporter protein A
LLAAKLEKQVLRVENLSCSRENKKLFSNLTFELTAGSCLQIRGPNGSGKSSLLKILVGLLAASSGKIYWQKDSQEHKHQASANCLQHKGNIQQHKADKEQDIGNRQQDKTNKDQDKIKAERLITFPDYDYLREILYLGHKTGVQTRLTSLENLKSWLEIRGYERQNQYPLAYSKVEQALQYWDLGELSNLTCEKLSAGQCQRLALARLTLVPVKLWVLDEPCSALDAEAIKLFEQLLVKHLESGGSAVIVSHSPLKIDNSRFFVKDLS